jgi:hypothetical protein
MFQQGGAGKHRPDKGGGTNMAKDRFLKSVSGKRFVRFSMVKEFLIAPTGQRAFPEPFQLSAFTGRSTDGWIVLCKGTEQECEATLEGLLKEEV